MTHQSDVAVLRKLACGAQNFFFMKEKPHRKSKVPQVLQHTTLWDPEVGFTGKRCFAGKEVPKSVRLTVWHPSNEKATGLRRLRGTTPLNAVKASDRHIIGLEASE